MEAKHPLETYLTSHEMSRAKLAALLGVSPATITRWVKGDRQPDPAKLHNITEKTGIPAKELRPDLAEKLGSNQ